tara:strand:+ start:1039 stop:1551 length:513 start_codon:yes stop_codon:yes gene_type:complete
MVIMTITSFWYIKNSNQNLAYVYVDSVLAEYHAMQDVNDRITLLQNEKSKSLDSVYLNLQERSNWLKSNYASLSKEELINAQLELSNGEREFMDLQRLTNIQVDSVRSASIEPIYEEINDFIKRYSNELGYDFVFGNLGNGNIMYATGASDITLEIIEGLNVEYYQKNSK